MIKNRIPGWKTVLQLAWPLIIANSFWNIQMTIDRIYLGQFSTESLGAAMAVFGVFWAPMALVQQTAAYVTTFVAQYYGAKRSSEIGPAVWQAIYVSIIGGLAFLFLIPAAPALFKFMGHSSNLRPLEIEYFNAMCYTALPTALMAAASGFFTGLGQSKTVMWINGVGLIFNVLFDYLLIFGNHGFPRLGIAGAGYATAIANCAAVFFSFSLMFSSKNEAIYRIRSQWRLNIALLKRFIQYGLPSGMQWALEGLSFTVFLIFVGQMPNGDAALAASGIAVTVMMLAVLPAMGVGQAVSVLVGQHLGDNNPIQAEKLTWSGVQVAALYIISVGTTFWMFPQFYLSWFYNPSSQIVWNQVSIIVPYLLMFVAAFTTFDCINMVISFALKGAGDTRFVTLVALILPWPIMIFPTSLVRSLDTGIYWAWAAASVFIVSQAFVFLSRFLGGKWKGMKVIEPLIDLPETTILEEVAH